MGAPRPSTTRQGRRQRRSSGSHDQSDDHNAGGVRVLRSTIRPWHNDRTDAERPVAPLRDALVRASDLRDDCGEVDSPQVKLGALGAPRSG